MNIGLSDLLAIAALIVSIFSMLYTKKQSELAKASHINDYRSQLSQYHSDYRKALTKIQKKHSSDLKELSTLAGRILVNIINHFDQYDVNHHAKRPLRHLLHESSEMVFRTFQGQLGWQTAENISRRLLQISFIEDNLNPTEHIFGKHSFREVINSQYILNPNKYLEIDLLNDIYFCDLVSEVKSRTSQYKIQELANSLQKETHSFNQLYSRLKLDFSKSSNHLRELITQGNKEHFQLKESHLLFNEIKRTQTILNTLSHIHFSEEIDKTICGKYPFFISKSIYICTLLHAIQCLHSWGWEYE